MKKYSILLFMLLLHTAAHAQIGGLRSFEWLAMPNHARSAALGTFNISSTTNDVNMIWDNASILSDTVDGQASITISPYIAGILNTQLSYAKKFNKLGLIGIGLQYLDLGDFEAIDNTGALTTQNFSAANYVLMMTNTRKFGAFKYGLNLKFAASSIESSIQSALLVDLSSTFVHPEQDLKVALLVKNLGFYTERHYSENRNLPFDIQLGMSFKPEFMPFRFSFSLNRLYRYDLSYQLENSNTNDFGLSSNSNEITEFDKFFQHVIIGAEILLGKNFALRTGYSHLLRQSLKPQEFAGAGGFTFGAAFNTKKIKLAYSTAVYQTGGNGHFITIATNLNQISKNRL